MKCYRIYTEDTNLNGIREIIDKYFDSYTLIYGTGVWKDKKENCLIIEIISENEIDFYVMEIAESIKLINSQESVLITSHEIEGKLI